MVIKNMRKLAILICFVNIILCTSAQSSTTKYFIGAFNPMTGSESIRKEGLNVYSGHGISFYATNNENKYTIVLRHILQLGGPNAPVILNMPIAALERLDEVIPAEELLKFSNSDSAYNWMLEAFTVINKEMYDYEEIRTKLYVIDTNKFYKSDPSLDKPDMMKVIEVRVTHEDIPKDILLHAPIRSF